MHNYLYLLLILKYLGHIFFENNNDIKLSDIEETQINSEENILLDTKIKNINNLFEEYIPDDMEDIEYQYEQDYNIKIEISKINNFNLKERFPNCASIDYIENQRSCGSCWAIAGVSVISDHICIAENIAGTNYYDNLILS